VLRKIVGPKRDEIRGEWRELRNKLHYLYPHEVPELFNYQIKKNVGGRTCDTRGKEILFIYLFFIYLLFIYYVLFICLFIIYLLICCLSVIYLFVVYLLFIYLLFIYYLFICYLLFIYVFSY
jgi:hypothetical protein